MSLSEICVRRPVFAFMLIMFLVTLGVFSFLDLGVDLFPRTDPATVYVRVRLPGASPEEVVSQIVLPLEETVASVSGIEEIRAMVSEGGASIIVTFVLEREIGAATEDVREKVSAAMRKLPPNVLPPTVAKSDPDNDAIVTLAVHGARPVRELTEVADKQVRRALETIDGVGAMDVIGGQLRQINVFLDIDKMNAYNLSAQEVERALRTENVETPGGRIVRGTAEMGVRTMGRLDHVSEFGAIIVKNVGGAPIRVRDVGYAEDSFAERRSFAMYQGQPAVTLEIRRQIGTNTVKVVDGILKRLDDVNKSLPPGVKISLVKEQATYIRKSVEALEEHLILGSFLAGLIVFLFIRDWRTVLISFVAIPTSILATFTILRLLDYTLNSMTLLGLTLAVGIVIDDAIIVIENIYRHLDEYDVTPIQAAIEATQEISLAVVATTLSLVIIFVPIAFISGYARKYLNQFGWTMSISILISMLVAFTLTPALSSRLLKRKAAAPGAKKTGAHEHHYSIFDKPYTKVLSWSLDHRWVLMGICALVFYSTFPLYKKIGRDWMPQEDQSELGVFVEMPEGSSLQATERVTKALSDRYAKIPGVRAVVPASSTMGVERVTMAFVTVLLDPPEKRAPILEMGNKIRAASADYAYARPRVNFPNVLGGRDTFAPIRAMLLGPDIRKLVEYGKLINEAMLKEPAITDVKVNLNLNNPELQVNIDRQLASDLGVRVADIAGAVRLLMSGEDQISTFKEGSEQYPVMMRLLTAQRDSPEVLGRLLVPSSTRGLIRLDSIAKLEHGLGPSRIDRYARQFGVGIYGNVANTSSLNEAAVAAQRVLDGIELPPGYSVRFSGQVKVLEETTSNMLMAIGLASIFMYMVLAAQFESLVHPFIILTTLPLSIPFALLSLIATDRSLNLFSALGVLLLLGIVKKNGILQIDYMNHLRDRGTPLREAIIEANRVRLRPILMTTFSIIAGLLPTAFGTGAGASQRSAIAVTIIGGQTLCLLLTLLLVPIGYDVAEKVRARLSSKKPTATTHDRPAASPVAGD
ncbi:MAG: efflux RND transporter permease subunit [Bryobacterales bacterium]|nr:efflux RND transporter permease subunit [Bryobacterales bacterium]